jgi:predicted DNA-binding transcriptional regulator YafY
LVEALHTSPRGLSNAQLTQRLGGSRATLYRDLRVLKGAGVPVVSEKVNGESRHRLTHTDLPALHPTALQLLALRVARALMSPFEGLSLVGELDALLGHTRGSVAEAFSFRLAGAAPAANPAAHATVERGLRERQRLAFVYQAPSADTGARRVVDPIGLRAADGHLYLLAFDVAKSSARTFKLARMREVEVLPQSAEEHPEIDEEALFAAAVKAWAGPTHEVVIKIPARLVGVAGEWPLVASQQVEDQGDGTALIKATVAGLVEAMRWVLRWGADAEALSPPELRSLVAAELAKACSYYDAPPSSEPLANSQPVSPG